MQKEIGQDGTDDAALRSSLGAFHQGSVRKLKRRCQPSSDVEPHPFALRVFLQRPQQQRVVDVVEQAFDVEFQNPVIPPATLARHRDGIQRGFTGPVAIRVRQEDRFEIRLKHCLTTICATRSATVGTPRIRSPPVFFGMATAFTGGGTVASRRHPVPDPIQIVLQVRFEVFDRLLVHAGRARVGFHGLEGLIHQPFRDGERFCRSHAFPPVAS